MAWVRVDDLAPTHAKVIQIGWGFGLFVAGLCHANRYLTDGFIPARQLSAVLPGVRPRQALLMAVKLVEAGLWEVKDDGYQIHDYHDYQPTAATVRSIRGARAESGRRGGQRKAEQAVSKPLANVRQNSAPPPTPTPTTQDPQKLGKNRKTPRADARSEAFERFWGVYPRRLGPDAAWKAWRAKGCEAIADEVIAAVARQREHLLRSGVDYCPYPATWLNGGRWKDEPPAADNGLRLSPKTREMIGAGQAWIERAHDDAQ